MLLGAAIAVVVFTVIGVTGCTSGSKHATPATSTPPAAVLDGTYRLDDDGAKATLNGVPIPTSNVTFWYVFRSSCRSTGCAATGTRLDDNNHQVAFTPATTIVLYFVGGHWQKEPARGMSLTVQRPGPQCLGPNNALSAGEDTEVQTESWAPQPDGTLRGIETDTFVTSECGHQGLVQQFPMVVTRVGDVPAGVTVADPATVPGAPATSSPAPAAAGPALNGTYRVDLDMTHQTVNGVPAIPGPNATHWWGFRSLCASSGCVATGARLSDTNHQEPGGVPHVLHFADGHWQDTPYLFNAPCPTGTSTSSWSWDPQPDGTLRGFETDTALTNECGSQGRVVRAPMVVTREGDVPPAAVLADPALFLGH